MSNPTLLYYTIVDAFTSTSFSGNPASVIILPTSHHSLSTESLLQIAAEFNLSETAFLIPQPSTSPGTLRYGLRWFTPTVEVPLCGHGTLASARAIFSTPEGEQVDRLEFETLSGTLIAKKVPGGAGKIELDFPVTTLEDLTSPDELARVSEVASAAVGGSVSVRGVRKAGLFLLVEVDPSFDLEGAVVDVSPFDTLPFGAIIVTSARPTSFRPGARFISRVFAPQSGVAEDPIAAEFNLSETAFLIPQTSNSPGTLRHGLRWFTPTVEMPICGHAMLASARVIFSTLEGQQVDTLEFDALSGTLEAKKVPGGLGKIELDLPASTLKELNSADELAQVSEVVCAAAGRGLSVPEARNAGFYLLVEFDPSFDLEGVVLDTDQFRKRPFDAVILTSSRPTSFRPSARFISRVLAPLSGIAEDPVCGSAHCVLAPYWSKVLGIPPGEVIEARQVGKRGGDSDLIWEKENGRVRIQGSAVVTMRGELYL